MNPNATNYSWSNTSQWSQVPNTPVNADQQNAQQMPINTAQQTSYSASAAPISTENRTDMIKRLYKSILGREADTAGLNYYLYNTHIPEVQIAREMFESTEHAEILQKAKDIREMIAKTEDATKKMSDMEYTLQSLQTLNENYKNLIDQKTQAINELRAQLNLSSDIQHSETIHQPIHFDHPEFQPPFQQNSDSINQNNFNGFTLEDPFAEEYTNRQGCLGWLKSWFKFN